MRSLLVLRHAKSDWAAGAQADVDRPLNDRGRAAARLVGQFLAASDQVPDAVVCSPAVRTRTTLELAMEAGGWVRPTRIAEALYGEGVAAAVNEVRTEDDQHGSLLVVGHQPTWQELVQRSMGGGRVAFPTAALARLDFDVDAWRSVQPGEGVLRFLVPPKLLPAGAFEG